MDAEKVTSKHSRVQIFKTIAQSFKRSQTDDPAQSPPEPISQIEAELLALQANLELPALGENLIGLFEKNLRALQGEVSKVGEFQQVVEVVEKHFDQHQLPLELVVSTDNWVNQIKWPDKFTIHRRAAKPDDSVSLTGAFAGIAETGSVVMLSSPQTPTTLNFLPDDHLVVLPVSLIKPRLEDIWAQYGFTEQGMPRAINIITGPSRTADVEQTIQIGAHGPRRFHVILIERE